MAERHAAQAKAAAKAVTSKKIVESVPDLPSTTALYYDDVSQQNFDASVLASLKLIGNDFPDGATHGIILDKTCFYPEGGGQEGDYGSLTCDSASHQVLDTVKVGDLILHLSNGSFEVGDLVRGEVDWERRRQLMDHHTAVHLSLIHI